MIYHSEPLLTPCQCYPLAHDGHGIRRWNCGDPHCYLPVRPTLRTWLRTRLLKGAQ